MQLQTRRMDLSRQKNTTGTSRPCRVFMNLNNQLLFLVQGILATCSRNELVSRCDATTGRKNGGKSSHCSYSTKTCHGSSRKAMLPK